THTGWLVGAVNEIARPLQIEREAAEGIVWTGADDFLELLAVLTMLLDHGGRHAPGGIGLAAHDFGHALGGRPSHFSNADGMSDHHLRLAGLVWREIKQAHSGDVDHDAGPRRTRNHELRRHHDGPVGTR